MVSLSRHDDRLAQTVQQLLNRLVVSLVFRRHLQFRRRDRDAKDRILAAASFFGEVLQEVVELSPELLGMVARPVQVVEKFVHQDQGGSAREDLPDHVPAWSRPLLIMACDRCERLLATQLPGDLAPGRFPQWFPALATATGERIELGPDEDG